MAPPTPSPPSPQQAQPSPQWLEVMQWWQQRVAEQAIQEVFGADPPKRKWTKLEKQRIQSQLESYSAKSEILHYRPHFKQSLFHRANCLKKLLFGANQTGKTRAVLAEAISWAMGVELHSGQVKMTPMGVPVKPPVHMMIAGEDFSNAIEGNIWVKLQELIPVDAILEKKTRRQGNLYQVIFGPYGSSIKFLSYEMDPSKFEGYTWSGPCFFDEPPPRAHYVATVRGCMKHEVPICFSQTPLKEPWVKDELVDSPDAVHVYKESDLAKLSKRKTFVSVMGLDENPYLTEDAKTSLKDAVDPEEAEARVFGRFAHLMGRVYKDYDPEIHRISPDYLQEAADAYTNSKAGATGMAPGRVRPCSWRDWPAGVVVDPHDRKPWAIGIFVITPRSDRVWVHEWPDFDFWSVKQWQWGVDEYAACIVDALRTLRLTNVPWWIMDPRFGRTPKATTSTTLIDEFAERGIYFDRNFWAGELDVTRPLVRDALRNEKVFWLEHLHNFHRSFMNHTWDDFVGRQAYKGVKETEKQKFKDYCDVARYAECAETRFFEVELSPMRRRRPPIMNAGIA